jgi:hypothetical protein
MSLYQQDRQHWKKGSRKEKNLNRKPIQPMKEIFGGWPLQKDKIQTPGLGTGILVQDNLNGIHETQALVEPGILPMTSPKPDPLSLEIYPRLHSRDRGSISIGCLIRTHR